MKTINWRNLIFFTSFTLVSLIGAPIYVYNFGLSLSEVLLSLFWIIATGLGITVGHHRLFAHRTFQASPLVVFLGLFFGAATFQESVLQWASQHRDHHKYADTEKDPYNIKQGFWYAHIGWILFRNHPICFDNVKDLMKNKMIVYQNKYYVAWAIAAGVITPLVFGILTGHFWGALFLSVFARVTFVHHGTFLINSAAHYFGKKTFDIQATARDNWIAALLTYGEGYHSFHHRFPSDYRNGYKWYHWDPSKWLIRVFEKIGWVSDLKRVSDFHIIAAKLAAEKDLAEHYLTNENHVAALSALKSRYEHIKSMLHTWEGHVREYGTLCTQLSDRSDAILKSAWKQAQSARLQFLTVRQQWVRFIQRPALSIR